MDVETTCDAIQTIVAGSALIKRAPPISEWPEYIDDGDLPLALTRPESGDWGSEISRASRKGVQTLGGGSRRGVYVTDVYVKAHGMGMVYEGIRDTLDIITAVGDLLDAATNLGSIVGGQRVKDGGLLMLKLGEAQYRGTRFTVELIEDF